MVRPYHFNSRPSARGDLLENAKKELAKKISIHAPPRGATMTLCARRWTTLRFQFTPLREGRRVRHALTDDVGDISIHAPPRGATFAGMRIPADRWGISIHAPPRGATTGSKVITGWSYISIHAPPRGATRANDPHWGSPKFQFTPLREGRQNALIVAAPEFNFNSRPSARGDRECSKMGMPPDNFNSRPSARGDDGWIPIA